MTNGTNDDIHDEKLRAAINALPREVQPERDLWPGIARQIAPQKSRLWVWPTAAAASALIAIAVIIAMLAMHPHETQTAVVAQPPAQSQPLSSAPALNARAKIIAATIRHSTRLDPKTQAVLLKNLEIIETSIANIQQALNESPNDTGLQPLLYQLYRDEAALVTAAQRVQIQTTTGVIAL